MRRLIYVFAALTALGCASDPITPDAGSDTGVTLADGGRDDAGAVDAGTGDAGASCSAVDPTVVTFMTDDGVTLEADLYLSGGAGGAAAVLLHMIPPSNTRQNYPREFIDALTEQCVTVLNVDRRGAGGSEGVATEAYMGPYGVLDAKAAVAFVLTQPVSPDRLAIVGASNGTTSLVDYVSLATSDTTAPSPAVAVLLSGGAYTEAQTAISASGLSAIPTLFAYPASEAGWNDTQGAMGNDNWSFREYVPGDHGTRLFGAVPPSVGHVAEFVLTHTAE